jgi:hypothetical protein
MENITIHSIEEARRKDGSEVSGVSKNGNAWKLYKINNKYSFFHFGEGEPEFDIGSSHDFVVEERQSGEFVNYTISLPKKGDFEKLETQKTFDDMRKAFAKLQKQVDDLEANLKATKDFLQNS